MLHWLRVAGLVLAFAPLLDTAFSVIGLALLIGADCYRQRLEADKAYVILRRNMRAYLRREFPELHEYDRRQSDLH